METNELKITASDGAEIIARLCHPDNASSDLLFLCLPAMGVKSAYYLPLAETLTTQGHTALLCDLRGQGTSNQKAPKAKFGYLELLEIDLPAYARAAQRACPDKKIILLGHSLGGHLSLLYTAAQPDRIQAIALIASGSVHYRGYPFPHNLKTFLGTQSSVLIARLCGYFPGHKIGFGGKQPQQIMRDWAYQGRTGRFAPKGSHINYEAAMREIDVPVFALSIEGDKFAPHSATDHLVSKLNPKYLTRSRYQPSDNLVSKINHFHWVKYNTEIIEELNDWVSSL